MKARNLILLILICILSICAFTGLLVYAFHIQVKRESNDNKVSLTPNAPTPTVSPEQSDNQAAVTNTPTPTDAASFLTATPTQSADIGDYLSEPIILGFAGDVNLDENSYPSAKYDATEKDILKCLSEDLINEMNAADIMMLNNEFAYSTRGTKEQNKSFTFRAAPDRVEILKKMGVDIVSLANNHALDYGPDALLDTFDTLDGAGIDYVGAGNNLDRAKAPVYYTIGDKKIAFIAASRVVFEMDWYASDNGLGMIGTYDPALIVESIKEAEKNSDFVIMFVHWGIERENYPVDYQRDLARKYIDAGADAVIGCHPHVMQGFEFYQGKPIAYSLGNFWFNKNTEKSGLLKLYLDPDKTVRVQINPAATKDTFTYLLTKEAEKKSYFKFMKDISFDVDIDEDGFISSAK